MKKLILIISIILSACTQPRTTLATQQLLAAPLPRLSITTDNIPYDCGGKVYKGIDLRADNVKLSNCFSVDSATNTGGVYIEGNGNTVSNVTVTGACMTGFQINGNNNIVEFNDISKSRQCDGQSGKDADGLRLIGSGNVIRYNYIHDIAYSATENSTAHIDCIQAWQFISNTTIEGNICDVVHAGIQTDAATNTVNLTIKNNFFRAARPLNLRCATCFISGNIFVGKVVLNVTGSYIIIPDSINITFVNNIIYETTLGILGRNTTWAGRGLNIFWNDTLGLPVRRDSDYNGSGIASDKWYTVNPRMSGFCSLAFPAIGAPCTGVSTPQSPTVTATIATNTPICTGASCQTITPTSTASFTPSPTTSLSPTGQSHTPTQTATLTPTSTKTPTATFSPSPSATRIPTRTKTPTPVPTRTATPTKCYAVSIGGTPYPPFCP